MSRFTPADLPDLTGKRIAITGANAGIGFHTAQSLAAKGAEVVMMCRNVDAAREAARTIPGRVEIQQVDLSSQASVHALADRFEGPLDVLINNAGVVQPPQHRTTEDGHELMFGTNHLGHFTLTGRLLPHLLEAPAPRVVTVGSVAHRRADGSVIDGNPAADYKPFRGYARSKLANLLFAIELHRRATAANSKLVSVAAHPGVSATELTRNRDGLGASWFFRKIAPPLLPFFMQSAKSGANPSLYAAALARPGTYTGPRWLFESRGPIGPAKVSPVAADPLIAARLWERSVSWTGIDFNFWPELDLDWSATS